MKKFSYTKVNGAGNDFVLIDKKINSGLELSEGEITEICDRENGIGADGVLIIDDSTDTDFKMEYYNADGSTGSLCGNGARCAIKYAEISRRAISKIVTFFSEGKKYRGELLENSIVKFDLNPPEKVKTKFKIKAGGQLTTAHYADTGSPHVVIDTDDILKDHRNPKSGNAEIGNIPVTELGREIRNLQEFASRGVNVNFIKIETEKVHIRSYERGVEAETLACGTGAVAAAIICSLVHKKSPPIKFITKSNAELIVNFDLENGHFSNISLTGPVEIENKAIYSF